MYRLAVPDVSDDVPEVSMMADNVWIDLLD
jgi:hypothetical protein